MTRTTELCKDEVNPKLSIIPLRCKGGQGFKNNKPEKVHPYE